MVENSFGILVSRFRVLPGTMEQKTQGCQRHCFNMCGVAQHAGDTSGQSRQGTQPRGHTALQNEQVVYLPDKNYRNPSMEAKHQ